MGEKDWQQPTLLKCVKCSNGSEGDVVSCDFCPAVIHGVCLGLDMTLCTENELIAM